MLLCTSFVWGGRVITEIHPRTNGPCFTVQQGTGGRVRIYSCLLYGAFLWRNAECICPWTGKSSNLKGQCHEIFYLFWRSNKLNQYFLNVRWVFLIFFSVLLFSCQNSKYLLTTVKTLTKSDDFTVTRLWTKNRASVTRFRMLEAAFSNPLQNQKINMS